MLLLKELFVWFIYGLVKEVDIPLQQIGALGCVIAYSFSGWALLNAMKARQPIALPAWVGWLGLLSCSILMAACINSFLVKGMSSLITYSLLSGFGIIMFCLMKYKKI